jgi:hypothetical protein
MPIFNDSEPRKPFVEPDDYILKIVGFEIGISTSSGVTKGSEQYEIEWEVEGQGARVNEKLWDHPNTAWKIDVMLKACGIKLTKGQSFSFRKDEAERNGWPWVDPIGLRCHASLIVEEYKGKSDPVGAPMRKSNKVGAYYTDRGFLPREVQQPAQQEDDVVF